jgi:hypothetical protein
LLAMTRFWEWRRNLFARYTSVCDLFNVSSGACALPPVVLDSDDDDPDDSTTYSSSSNAFTLNWQFLLFHTFCKFFILLELSYRSKCIVWNHNRHFYISLWENFRRQRRRSLNHLRRFRPPKSSFLIQDYRGV